MIGRYQLPTLYETEVSLPEQVYMEVMEWHVYTESMWLDNVQQMIRRTRGIFVTEGRGAAGKRGFVGEGGELSGGKCSSAPGHLQCPFNSEGFCSSATSPRTSPLASSEPILDTAHSKHKN